MPTKTLTTEKFYTKLLKELKSILLQSLKRVEQERVRAYWQTGRIISDYLLEGKQYGDGLFERLSEDLEIDKRTLEKSVRLYQVFPIANTCPRLGWSHYRLLITVQEKEKRLDLENRAFKEKWSARELQEQIRLEGLRNKEIEKVNAPAKKLKLVRGRLYTYRLIKPATVSLAGRPNIINTVNAGLLVDCGFYFWRNLLLKGVHQPQEGDAVESVKTGAHYSFKISDAKRKHLYTYKALVERVVDADTIWVHIDLGFNSWSRQKVRFRGIDAPEISTKKGQEAKEFVEAQLSKVSFIIIRSTSRDKYGRPLSDIFYLEGESDPQAVLKNGTFLNQELLDRGLAKPI